MSVFHVELLDESYFKKVTRAECHIPLTTSLGLTFFFLYETAAMDLDLVDLDWGSDGRKGLQTPFQAPVSIQIAYPSRCYFFLKKKTA